MSSSSSFAGTSTINLVAGLNLRDELLEMRKWTSMSERLYRTYKEM